MAQLPSSPLFRASSARVAEPCGAEKPLPTVESDTVIAAMNPNVLRDTLLKINSLSTTMIFFATAGDRA
jgi:hypothetical protein